MSKRIMLILFALCFGSMAITGCDPGKTDPNQNSSRPDKDYAKTQMSTDKTCKVTYSFDQDAEWPPKNETFKMVINVADKDGKTDGEFEIKVDADMPEHGHGMNVVPEVKSMGKGKFEITGMLFHMRGWWEIYVDVTKGCGPSKATFNTFVE